MKKSAFLLLASAAFAATTSCSKKDDPAATSGPKDYKVEYRVSSTSAKVADDVTYMNTSGGFTSLKNVTLPATYSFTRNMKFGDGVAVNATTASAASTDVTVSILIDGSEVAKKTGTGAGTIGYAEAVWVVPN